MHICKLMSKADVQRTEGVFLPFVVRIGRTETVGLQTRESKQGRAPVADWTECPSGRTARGVQTDLQATLTLKNVLKKSV